MKNGLLYIIACLPFFASCQQKETLSLDIIAYDLKKTASIAVDKQLTYSITPFKLKTFQFGSAIYLTYYDQTVSKIFIHQIANNTLTFIDTINTRPRFKRGHITDYTLISLDSIVLAFNPAYHRDAHDSTLCLIDRRGNLISSIDFAEMPVITRSKREKLGSDVSQAYPYFLTYLTFPLFYHNQLHGLIGHFGCMRKICGYHFGNIQNEMHATLLPFGGGNKLLNGITFGLDTGIYYSLDARFARGAYNDNSGEVVFSFGYNNLWQVLDTNLTVKKIKVNSYILDTIYPLRQPYDEYFDYSRGDYSWIRFNRYSNEYYRFIRVGNNVFNFPDETILPTKVPQNETYILQIVDSNFVLAGEALFPVQYVPSALAAYGRNIILMNEEESSKKGRLIFDIIKLVPKKTSMAEYRNTVKKRLYKSEKPEAEQYADYARQIYGRTYKQNIFINVDAGCLACKDYLFSYLKENLVKMEGKDISVTLITKSKKNLLNKLGNISLPNNVVIDSEMVYKKHLLEIMYVTELYHTDGKFEVKKHELSKSQIIFELLDKFKL